MPVRLCPRLAVPARHDQGAGDGEPGDDAFRMAQSPRDVLNMPATEIREGAPSWRSPTLCEVAFSLLRPLLEERNANQRLRLTSPPSHGSLLRAGLPLTCFLGFGLPILAFVVVFFFAMIVSSCLDPLNVILCVPAVPPRSAGPSVDLAGLVGASAGPESTRSGHPALSGHFAAGRPDGSAATCREPSASTA
jgi:hypothetical protein